MQFTLCRHAIPHSTDVAFPTLHAAALWHFVLVRAGLPGRMLRLTSKHSNIPTLTMSPQQTHEFMGVVLAENQVFVDQLQATQEALVWCSGSVDFQEGGIAHENWKANIQPIIDNNYALIGKGTRLQSTDGRKAQVLNGVDWVVRPFDKIEIGDVFRVFEEDGTPILHSWLATRRVYTPVTSDDQVSTLAAIISEPIELGPSKKDSGLKVPVGPNYSIGCDIIADGQVLPNVNAEHGDWLAELAASTQSKAHDEPVPYADTDAEQVICRDCGQFLTDFHGDWHGNDGAPECYGNKPTTLHHPMSVIPSRMARLAQS